MKTKPSKMLQPGDMIFVKTLYSYACDRWILLDPCSDKGIEIILTIKCAMNRWIEVDTVELGVVDLVGLNEFDVPIL